MINRLVWLVLFAETMVDDCAVDEWDPVAQSAENIKSAILSSRKVL
jgi:hypothetical protein